MQALGSEERAEGCHVWALGSEVSGHDCWLRRGGGPGCRRRWVPAATARPAVVRAVLLLMVVLGMGLPAMASGPRWVSGPPYFSTSGVPIHWYLAGPKYYTDPGDLSATVNHAAADALVANAAAVWNVPTSSLVVAQGGVLAEHVTGASITVSGGGAPVMPADVQSSNWQSIQIAILYDTDGSVIDALLGAGGSDPSGCLQNGVIESVDLFGTAGTIEHAILILNGRCTGADARLETQMQYQLVRAFGRILGVGWSQTNDAVFTATTAHPSTGPQRQYWPVMHPIDVICGPYTYQCMPSPFTLRPDDVSALAQLYYVYPGDSAYEPGKQDTLSDASEAFGSVLFPDGSGMEGVNVTAQRHSVDGTYYEPFEVASAVSGSLFRQRTGTPIAGQDGSAMSSIGTYDSGHEGYFDMAEVPIMNGYSLQDIVLATEPVNPLYTGPYALTTAAASSSTIAPSGPVVSLDTGIWIPYARYEKDLSATYAVASCAAGSDGTESAPVAMPASGWWTGVLCGYGHSSWTSLNMKINHSFSVELTALNEAGAGSAVKAMPMIGLWQASDATGQSPTVASSPIAFNSGVAGMTTVQLSSAPASQLRMVFTDERGAGRNDFAYQARVLYADAVTPANVGAYGGTVVISGTGFRPGMQVTVNGYSAVVTAVTPTSITVKAPSLPSIGLTHALLATVGVLDPTTGGTTTIPEALGYGSPQERLQLVSAPSGTVVQGRVAGTPFAVRVLAPDGVTPMVGETVTLAFTAGSGTLGVCGAASCTVQTDANGMASTGVTVQSVGGVALKASTALLTLRASFTSVAAPDMVTLVSVPASVATLGLAAPTMFAVQVTAGDGVTPRVGQTVTLAAEGGAAQLVACAAASCSLRTDANGMVSTGVVPLVAGTIVLDGEAAAGAVQGTFIAAAQKLVMVSAPTGAVTVGTVASPVFTVAAFRADGLTPMVGQAVSFAATGGPVLLGACGGATCSVMTDVNGLATTTVTPQMVGPSTVTASAAGNMVSTTIVGQALPDVIKVVSVPTGMAYAGTQVSPGLVMRLVLADGVTPVAGQVMTFRVTAGAANLGSCGGSICSVVTDANGMAAMTVTPALAGGLTVVMSVGSALQAAAQTVSLAVAALERTVIAVEPVQYVAEGVSASWTEQVAVSDNATATAGVPVVWTGDAALGMVGAGSGSVVSAGGLASQGVEIAGLGAGISARGRACAWTVVCAGFAVEGVSATAWQIQVVAGAGQQVSAQGVLGPVTLRVTDAAGHAVLGVTVTVHQQMTAWQQACPVEGRCTGAAVLGSAVSTVVSDVNGLLVVEPLQMAGVAEVTAVTASAGTAGVRTVVLEKHP